MSKVLNEAQQAASNAITKMGGPAEAGRKLTERLREREEDKTIPIGVVWSWINRDKHGVPIRFILDIEALSDIPREELRPDIPWR